MRGQVLQACNLLNAYRLILSRPFGVRPAVPGSESDASHRAPRDGAASAARDVQIEENAY